MKLYGATMLRNEADIVEPFVRHNLTLLDGLIAVDHGSQDGTGEILAALAAEGLPLEIEHDKSVGYFQSEIMTRTSRRIFAERNADYVFALDADEFIKMPSRPVLEGVLASIPPGLHAAMDWQTYVPEFDGAPPPRNPMVLAKRRLAQERHGLYKVIVNRALSENPDAVIAMGNHLVLPSARPGHVPSVNLARLSADVVALAHLPVRSARQLTNKILVGWLAHCAAKRHSPNMASHWRDLYKEMRDADDLTPQRLTMIAANYGLPMDAWRSPESLAFAEDPLPVSEVRYAHLARDATLSLVVRFAERFLSQGAS